MKSVSFQIEPGGTLRAEARVPGDKSISHRALMLGAIARGETRIYDFLASQDTLATLHALRAMGVEISRVGADEIRIQGAGLTGLQAPSDPLDLGNSGTSMRLLCGLLSGQAFDSVLVGDESLSRRPMRRVTDPLQLMGAKISSTEHGTAPLRIHGGNRLQGIQYALPVASAQVKSSLLLAGLYASGQTCITEPECTRDHTERMLRGFSCAVDNHDRTICIHGRHNLIGTEVQVPADLSSAAFFMVGASIASGSDIVLRQVGVNPSRTGIIHILRMMGANIELLNPSESGGEPMADIRVRSSTLKGIKIPESYVSLAIDEFPILFVAAACAHGKTVLTGARELRLKESDRIAVMQQGLSELGIATIATDDGMMIEGGEFGGGEIDCSGDHRIAMSFSIAALRAKERIQVTDCANVETSFPGFVESAKSMGLNISTHGSCV